MLAAVSAAMRPATRIVYAETVANPTTAVADLKQSAAGDLTIMGSGNLIDSLMAAGLIDQYMLMIHPLVLGTGRRLFGGGVHASLRLTDSVTTTTGVVIATYEATA